MLETPVVYLNFVFCVCNFCRQQLFIESVYSSVAVFFLLNHYFWVMRELMGVFMSSFLWRTPTDVCVIKSELSLHLSCNSSSQFSALFVLQMQFMTQISALVLKTSTLFPARQYKSCQTNKKMHHFLTFSIYLNCIIFCHAWGLENVLVS